jgi:transposase
VVFLKNIVLSNKEKQTMDIRREIKSYIVREGLSMREVLERLSVTHKWSGSLSNFSGKLQRGTLRYSEAEDIAEVLGYEIVWIKKDRR